jgi:hypothetical protein
MRKRKKTRESLINYYGFKSPRFLPPLVKGAGGILINLLQPR